MCNCTHSLCNFEIIVVSYGLGLCAARGYAAGRLNPNPSCMTCSWASSGAQCWRSPGKHRSRPSLGASCLAFFFLHCILAKKKKKGIFPGGMDSDRNRCGALQRYYGCPVVCWYRDIYAISILRYEIHMLNWESLLFQAKPNPTSVPRVLPG